MFHSIDFKFFNLYSLCNIKKENQKDLIKHFKSSEHILKEHKILDKSKESEKDLTCPTCYYVFIRKSALNAHLNRFPNHKITNKNYNPSINTDF